MHGGFIIGSRLLWLVGCRAASRKLLGGTFAFLGVLGSGFSCSTPGVKSVTRYKLSDPGRLSKIGVGGG